MQRSPRGWGEWVSAEDPHACSPSEAAGDPCRGLGCAQGGAGGVKLSALHSSLPLIGKGVSVDCRPPASREKWWQQARRTAETQHTYLRCGHKQNRHLNLRKVSVPIIPVQSTTLNPQMKADFVNQFLSAEDKWDRLSPISVNTEIKILNCLPSSCFEISE